MKGQFAKEEIERLAEMFFADALQVHFGCAMEPTMFRDYPWLVELAKRYRVPFIGFTTNGQIVAEPAYERMIRAGLDEITVSTHGVGKATYEDLMPGADFERLLANLAMIDAANREAGSRAPKLRLNYTVCPANLDELDNFLGVYGRFKIATIQLRPVADFGDTAYTDKNLRPHLERYNAAVRRMIEACRGRNIALLANRLDPTHDRPNPAAPVYLIGVLRYLNPNTVWREDFDWQTTDYRTHKRRIGWRRQLLARALGPNPRSQPSHQAIFEAF
jgi:molybdenum cofactor biosynthesis enzyme MoaA